MVLVGRQALEFLENHRDSSPEVMKVNANVDVMFFDASHINSYNDYKRYFARKDSVRQAWFYEGLQWVKSHQFGHNLITAFGANQICNLIAGVNTLRFRYVGVGQGSNGTIAGTNDPASGDTDLQGAIGARVEVTNPFVFNDEADMVTFFTNTMNNGLWTELIIATATSGANACARFKLEDVFNMDGNVAAIVVWVVTVTPVVA